MRMPPCLYLVGPHLFLLSLKEQYIENIKICFINVYKPVLETLPKNVKATNSGNNV